MYGSSRNICDRVVEIGEYSGENDHPDFRRPANKLKRGRRYMKHMINCNNMFIFSYYHKKCLFIHNAN